MSQSIGNPSPYADSPDAGRIMSRIVDQLQGGAGPSATLTAAYALKRNIGTPRSSSSRKAAFSRTHAYAARLSAGKEIPGEPGRPFAPPRDSDALHVREEQKGAGIYGIGIKIDVTPPFKVQRVVNLRDARNVSINDTVSVGDRLVYVDGQAIEKAEYLNFAEKLIFGEKDTTVTLTFKRREDDTSYKVIANRHVPIKVWDVTMKWAELRTELVGKELMAEPSIVETLENIRISLHDSNGAAIDILKDDVHEPSSLGLRLAMEASNSLLRPLQIENVTPGGPAFMGGDLMVGDEVVSVDGVTATESNVLKLLQGNNVIGSKCFLSVKRQARTFDARLVRLSCAHARQLETLMSSIATLERTVADSGNLEALDLAKQVQVQACRVESERCQRDIDLAERVAGLHSQIVETLNQAELKLHPNPDSKSQLALRKIEELNAQLSAANDSKLESQKHVIDLSREGSELQKRLGESHNQLASLRAGLGSMVPRAVHERVQESLEAVGADKRRLEERVEALQEEVRRTKEESAGLRAGLGGMVPREELDRALSELERRSAEAGAPTGMVTEGELNAERAETQKMAAMVQELRQRLRGAEAAQAGGLVPVGALAAVEGELAETRRRLEEAGAARAELAARGAGERECIGRLEGELQAAEEQVGELQALARLGAAAGGRGWKERAEEAEARVEGLQAEAEALGREREELEGALERERGRAEGMVPRGEQAAVRREGAASKEEAEAEAAQRRRAEAEGEAQRREVQALRAAAAERVPRSELLAAMAEAREQRERAERLSEEAVMQEKEREEQSEEAARLVREAAAVRAAAADKVERRELEAAEERAAQAQQDAEAARARGAGLGEEAAALGKQVEELRRQLGQSVGRGELEAAEAEAKARAKEARALLEEVQLREEEGLALQAQLKALRDEADAAAAAQADKAQLVELRQSKERVRVEKERSQDLEAELEAAKGRVEELERSLAATAAELETLREQAAGSVWRETHEAVLREARAGKEAGAEWEAKALAAERAAQEAREQVRGLREEVERLRREGADGVPRGQLVAAESRTRLLQAECGELGLRKAELGGQVAGLRGQLRDEAAQREALRARLADSVPRQELLHAQEAGSAAEARAEALEREVEALMEVLEGCKEQLWSVVGREQLEAAEARGRRVTGQLSALQRQLAEAGLAQPEALRGVTEALRGPGAMAAREAAALLEGCRGGPRSDLQEVAALVRRTGAEGGVSARELLELLGAVEGAWGRAGEAAGLLAVAGEAPPLTAGELRGLRGLVVAEGAGAEARGVEETAEVLARVPTLRALLEEREGAGRRRRELEAAKGDREEEAAALRLRVCPSPQEHEEVAALQAENAALRREAEAPCPPIMEPEGRAFAEAIKVKVRAVRKGARVLCTTDDSAPSEANHRAAGASPLLVELRSTETLRAVCVDGAGRVSAVTTERYECEKGREGMAGIGLLLERVAEQTQVKSVRAGGAAAADGRIRANDLLLKIDGRDVKGLSLSAMVKLTQGRAGTQIALLLAKPPDIAGGAGGGEPDAYSVTLTRVATREGSKLQALAQAEARGGGSPESDAPPPPHAASILDGSI